MQIDDRIYGRVEVDEPVLLDLLACEAVQRLGYVLQHGISGLLGITSPVTRLEHSVGVMLLARRLGASLEEQAAALLHDVSHTAFSHVIDYVVHNHNGQSFHDDVKAEYVAGTDIPARLAAHGYDWEAVIDEGRFSLLEQPAPALCADRLDYFLRDGLDLQIITRGDLHVVLEHLVVFAGRIVIDDRFAARLLADAYMQADERSWAEFREVGLYELTARAIRHALEIGVISPDDFWSTDRVVWQKMHTSPDPAMRQMLALVSTKTRFEWVKDAPDFVLTTKIRTLDPDVLLDGVAVPLSELDSAYAARRNAYIDAKAGLWPYRVIPPT